MSTYPHQNMPITGDSPAPNGEAVTPSDTADLPNIPRAVYVGVSGDVEMKMAGNGKTVVFKSVPIGFMPVVPRRILAGNTTATNMIAVW